MSEFNKELFEKIHEENIDNFDDIDHWDKKVSQAIIEYDKKSRSNASNEELLTYIYPIIYRFRELNFRMQYKMLGMSRVIKKHKRESVYNIIYLILFNILILSLFGLWWTSR